MRFEISKGLQLINFNLKEAMTVVSKRNVRKRTRDHTPESVGAFRAQPADRLQHACFREKFWVGRAVWPNPLAQKAFDAPAI